LIRRSLKAAVQLDAEIESAAEAEDIIAAEAAGALD
jgi:hypothetical protein